MKKMVVAAAIACAAAFVQAASVGWSAGAVGTANAGNAYYFFVIGQKGVESVSTVTSALDKGDSVSGLAFGSGKVADNGNISSGATAAGAPTLGAGTYTAFLTVFDTATPTAGSSKYVLISGQTNLTKTIGASTATVTFAGGNVSDVVGNADNWKSFGAAGPGPGPDPTPEPTSGLLLLVGGAMLALRRKQK